MNRFKICCIFFIISLAAYGQMSIKDTIQIILQNDDITDFENRFIFAYNHIFYYSSPEEAEELAMNIVYPYVQRTWKSKSEQLAHLARLQLLVGFCHRERGGEDRDAKERMFLEKALETAIKSENDAACARCYYACANMEFKRGDVKQAHEYLYRAIDYYDKMEMYTRSSEMLFLMASNFFDIKDTDGMEKILRQMKECLEKDKSKQSLYQYNMISHCRLDLLLEKEKTENGTVDYRMVDSMAVHIKQNIYLVENFPGELSPFWMHGYACYFWAKAVNDYYPEQTDTIFLYLNKAFEMFEKESFSRREEANAVKEFQIHTGIVRMKTLFREGKVQEAYSITNEVLSLLDELKNYKNLDIHRYDAYQFMSDYFEMNNKPVEALKYQKLLRNNEAQRYETEKIQAINNTAAKYETEKKEIQIQTLAKENKAVRRILWLTICLSLALLTTAVFIILLNRLKRKNVEQQLYETALLAELRQNELEKMQNAQQQSEQYPVNNTIENITQILSASIIEKDYKKTYLDRLSKIDAKLLENVYQTSKVKITSMDMKYIICFAADMDVKDISLLFNVEPASVHTVRYRIRKKFAKEDSFRMIL